MTICILIKNTFMYSYIHIQQYLYMNVKNYIYTNIKLKYAYLKCIVHLFNGATKYERNDRTR